MFPVDSIWVIAKAHEVDSQSVAIWDPANFFLYLREAAAGQSIDFPYSYHVIMPKYQRSELAKRMAVRFADRSDLYNYISKNLVSAPLMKSICICSPLPDIF